MMQKKMRAKPAAILTAMLAGIMLIAGLGFFAACDNGSTSKKVDSISIEHMPRKTTYLVGDALDKSGLEIKVLYEDGSEEMIDPNSADLSFDFDSSSEGLITVTVTYKGKTTIFRVRVNSPSIFSGSLISISVSAQPNKTSYRSVEPFDPEGMVVIAAWSGGLPDSIVPHGDLSFDHDFSASGAVTVRYGHATAEVSVSIVSGTLESLVVVTPPTATQLWGQPLNLDGLVVQARWTGGAAETIPLRMLNISGYKSDSTEEQSIMIAYGGKSAVFTVKPFKVDRIEYVSGGDFSTYIQGANESFRPEGNGSSGVVIKVHYSDGTSEEVTLKDGASSFFRIINDPDVTTAPRPQVVQITYGGNTVIIPGRTITYAAMTGFSYVSGGDFDSKYYDDGSADGSRFKTGESGVLINLNFAGTANTAQRTLYRGTPDIPDNVNAGSFTINWATGAVTISYNGYTQEIPGKAVQVLESIEYVSGGDFDHYYIGPGDPFLGVDRDRPLVIRATYSNGGGTATRNLTQTQSNAANDFHYSMSIRQDAAPGSGYYLSITYRGKTARAPTPINIKQLDSIEYMNGGDFTKWYADGDDFDPGSSGVTIKLNYNDGDEGYTTLFMPMYFTINANLTVSINYQGMTTVIPNRTVTRPPAVQSIVYLGGGDFTNGGFGYGMGDPFSSYYQWWDNSDGILRDYVRIQVYYVGTATTTFADIINSNAFTINADGTVTITYGGATATTTQTVTRPPALTGIQLSNTSSGTAGNPAYYYYGDPVYDSVYGANYSVTASFDDGSTRTIYQNELDLSAFDSMPVAMQNSGTAHQITFPISYSQTSWDGNTVTESANANITIWPKLVSVTADWPAETGYAIDEEHGIGDDLEITINWNTGGTWTFALSDNDDARLLCINLSSGEVITDDIPESFDSLGQYTFQVIVESYGPSANDQFTINVGHTVTFNANGGEFEDENGDPVTDPVVIKGVANNASVTPPTITQSGKILLCWSTDKDATDDTDAYDFTSTLITDDVEVWAIWEDE